MCNGNAFLARKKAETHFDCSCAVEIAFFFLRGEKSRETCGLIMRSGHLFFGRKHVDSACVLDVASSLAVLKPQCQGWNNRRPNQIWKTRCLLPIARTKYY